MSEGRFTNQYIAAVVVNVIAFEYGCALGWISPAFAQVFGDNSPLEEKPTPQQASLIGSLVCVGGLVGTPIFGWLVDALGRRTAAMLSSAPFLIGFALALLWKTAHGLMVARVFMGLGGAGAFLVAPLYAIEVASPAIRGRLGSFMVLGMNLGIVFMYAVGFHASYAVTQCVMVCFPLAFFLVMWWMPETPPYLVRKNRHEEASKAIAWLRGVPVDGPEVKQALVDLKYEAEMAKASCATLSIDGDPTKEATGLKLIMKHRSTRSAFTVVFLLLTTQVFLGLFVIITYASYIFEVADTNISASVSSIVVASLQFIGSVFASSLIERLGRKMLLIASCGVVSVSMAVLGAFFCLQSLQHDVSSIGWIPVTALSLVVSTFAIGIGPIPFFLPSEVLIGQARGVCMSILFSWFWISSGLVGQFYGAAVDLMGMHGVFWVFSVVGVAGILTTIFLLPETKGKPLDEIVAFFDGKKSLIATRD